MEYQRTPQQVVGSDPEMLRRWDRLSDAAKTRLLNSQTQVTTPAELEILAQHIDAHTEEPPAAF